MATARRVYLYAMAFAGLLAVLFAVSGLAALFVATLTLQAQTLLGVVSTRTQVSLYLAALIVGLPLLLGHLIAAEREAARSPVGGESLQRRVFRAAVFATTSLVVLFALYRLLRFLFTLPAAGIAEAPRWEAITASVRFLTYGAAWLLLARPTSPPADLRRSALQHDEWHDLAVLILAGTALGLFAIGLGRALRQILTDLLAVNFSGYPTLVQGPAEAAWSVWGNLAAMLLAGGVLWTVAWRAAVARRLLCRLRVAYLYLVLLIAVPATLGGGVQVLAGLFRRAFGDGPAVDTWGFVRDGLPVLLVGGLVWSLHWWVLREQAQFVTAPAAPAPGIPWPRRPALVFLVLLGLVVAAPALGSLLWLGLDALLQTGAALSGPGWWRDRLSFSLAADVAGTGLWLASWSVLQRAGALAPEQEGASLSRRLLLGTVTLAAGLTAIGFTISLLWLGIRALLGDTLSPGTVSLALKELSAILVALALAAYHGVSLRSDLRRGLSEAGRRTRLFVLLAPDADDVLQALREHPALLISVAGVLTTTHPAPELDLTALWTELATPIDTRRGGRAVLVLSPNGGTLYRYQLGEDATSPRAGG